MTLRGRSVKNHVPVSNVALMLVVKLEMGKHYACVNLDGRMIRKELMLDVLTWTNVLLECVQKEPFALTHQDLLNADVNLDSLEILWCNVTTSTNVHLNHHVGMEVFASIDQVHSNVNVQKELNQQLKGVVLRS